MKITDIKIISFKAITRATPTKWGYGVWGEEHDDIQRIIKIETDEGVEGVFTGGNGYFLPPPIQEISNLRSSGGIRPSSGRA